MRLFVCPMFGSVWGVSVCVSVAMVVVSRDKFTGRATVLSTRSFHLNVPLADAAFGTLLGCQFQQFWK